MTIQPTTAVRLPYPVDGVPAPPHIGPLLNQKHLWLAHNLRGQNLPTGKVDFWLDMIGSTSMKGSGSQNSFVEDAKTPYIKLPSDQLTANKLETRPNVPEATSWYFTHAIVLRQPVSWANMPMLLMAPGYYFGISSGFSAFGAATVTVRPHPPAVSWFVLLVKTGGGQVQASINGDAMSAPVSVAPSSSFTAYQANTRRSGDPLRDVDICLWKTWANPAAPPTNPSDEAEIVKDIARLAALEI